MYNNELAIRYRNKRMKGEEFFNHVYDCIKRQLLDWDKEYRVDFVKVADYNIIVNKESQTYNVVLTEEEIESLKKRGPYALDWEVWRQLENQGLSIHLGDGDYLEKVL